MEVGRLPPCCVESHLSPRAGLPSGEEGVWKCGRMFASHIDRVRLWVLGGWMETLGVSQLTGKFPPPTFAPDVHVGDSPTRCLCSSRTCLQGSDWRIIIFYTLGLVWKL